MSHIEIIDALAAIELDGDVARSVRADATQARCAIVAARQMAQRAEARAAQAERDPGAVEARRVGLRVEAERAAEHTRDLVRAGGRLIEQVSAASVESEVAS